MAEGVAATGRIQPRGWTTRPPSPCSRRAGEHAVGPLDIYPLSLDSPMYTRWHARWVVSGCGAGGGVLWTLHVRSVCLPWLQTSRPSR